MKPILSTTRPMSVVCAAALLAACAAVFSGCTIGRLIGGMAESSRRQGMHEEKAKYTGLTDKTFAVIVAADRSIQADFPSVISVVTLEITKRLADNSGAKGVLPATEVLKYQSQHPGWVAKPLNTLAKELAVERVVYVDLQDFTLTDPGNPYIYNGVASGTIHVIDPESATPGEFAFGEAVRVKYPDMSGMGPTQIPRNQVLSELARRFIERSAWALYTHEEPNVIKY